MACAISFFWLVTVTISYCVMPNTASSAICQAPKGLFALPSDCITLIWTSRSRSPGLHLSRGIIVDLRKSLSPRKFHPKTADHAWRIVFHTCLTKSSYEYEHARRQRSSGGFISCHGSQNSFRLDIQHCFCSSQRKFQEVGKTVISGILLPFSGVGLALAAGMTG